MEKILEMLLAKDLIADSKGRKLLSLMFNLIIATLVYKLIFGEFELIDFSSINAIANFIISGRIISILISYMIVWLFFLIVYTFVYRIFTRNFSQMRFGMGNLKEVEERVHIHQFPRIRDLLMALGLVRIERQTLIFTERVKEAVEKYFLFPRTVAYNICSVTTLGIQFFLTFLIVNSKEHYSCFLVTTIVVIFIAFMVIMYAFIKTAAAIEASIPHLKKMEMKTHKDLL